MDEVCQIKIGIHSKPYWKEKNSTLTVCSRHKSQFDERSGLPPIKWEKIMEPEEVTYVWVVRENTDKTEGRGPMVDVAICSSLDEAMRKNYDISGTMGHPPHHGGQIVRVQLGTYPLIEEKVWDYRKDWNGKYGMGWVDLRDKPNPDDSEWKEYQRLKAKFDSANTSPYSKEI